ncbi:MAG: hypothetical protein V1685_02640 [Parcubacteria group bacterium]
MMKIFSNQYIVQVLGVEFYIEATPHNEYDLEELYVDIERIELAGDPKCRDLSEDGLLSNATHERIAQLVTELAAEYARERPALREQDLAEAKVKGE